MAPPVWGGAPTKIVATSCLLYASLLISLLAAFVAMLGKQWLNRTFDTLMDRYSNAAVTDSVNVTA